MPNYENSKIYKLVNTTTKQIYIGSTTRDLSLRYNEHKSKYITGKTQKEVSYKLFNETDKVIIELIENVNCKSKEELIEREQHHIKNTECINKVIPKRTKSEYYQDTKRSLTNYHINKEENNKRRAEKVICECGAIVSKSVLYKHRKTKKHNDILYI